MSRKQRRTYPNLASFMDGEGLTQVELAARLRRSQPFISKLRRGLVEPSLREALRISRETGVPVESFVSSVSNLPAEKA
jgi:transcriptional regulator with XRE-family HTH domain